ncbi:sensor histidine kinase [Exiguobacterium alkaliphilum]|uniref:Sensor histidine kinase n=1 Tax=Exiguobacterium alkaliphilum TaxID=1428684 RepID=A0ABT2L126_9BACL|nr:sensor histidine kinase [Exiguobacterium alkaliphilum]MCT4796583.1 sensor histidine kinase [Exiguobacterium alkaliphilum]
MTPDQMNRIFERFYQADPSRHQGESGFGMAIVQKIVALRLIPLDLIPYGLGNLS